jgi:glycosyltransferase involved in cell wall biosynthesis
MRSILDQAGVSVRIWLCPDGPDDTAVSVAKAIGDERIALLSFDRQVGVAANVERGLEAALAASAAGDFFAFSDQDDSWHPEKLASGVAALPSDPIALSTHDARVVDGNGKLLAPSLNAYERRHRYLDQLGLLIANNVSGMTIVATREAVRRALPFPPNVPVMLHDWWLALVVSGCGRITALNEKLLDYRQHKENVIGAKPPIASPIIRLRPLRPFLGPAYRQMAKETFQSRREIALHLRARAALADSAAGFFLHRRFGSMLRRWPDSELRRYAIRCTIGMLLSS